MLRLRGLMAVAPLGEDPGTAFDRLAGVRAEIVADHPDADLLSAGMSGDLEAAVTSRRDTRACRVRGPRFEALGPVKSDKHPSEQRAECPQRRE